MDLYLAGEYVFAKPVKLDIGILSNRLLSYDYQRKFVDTLSYWKKDKHIYMQALQRLGGSNLDLFLAGMEEFVLHDLKADSLFSYLDKTYVEKLKDYIKPSKLFIDSGAFSAWTKGVKIDVKEYINWLNLHSDDIYLCGQVDFIPGDRVHGATMEEVKFAAKKTWENYLFMRKRLKNPDSLLYTFHVGEPFEYLINALEWVSSDGKPIPYIALGGMVGKPKWMRDQFLEKCFRLISRSNNPDVKVHAFGMTDFELLRKYPIYSADSTSWIMIGAMGNIMSDYGTISISTQQRNNKDHYSRLPEEAQKTIQDSVSNFGFTLEELASDRDCRILYNAKYMLDKAKSIQNTSKTVTRKGLF
jgi:hypothetical protein